MRAPRDGLIRAMVMGACALAFVLLVGVGYARAETRLIAHFEDDGGAHPFGRDVLADFYQSQTAPPEDNLFPNSLTADNLEPFALPNTFFSSGGGVPADPFELHQYTAGGGAGLAGLIGECRFAAFGSGWSLGVQDQVVDFQINFIAVTNEDDDDDYTPVNPWSADPELTNNNVDGDVQVWSDYDYLCFYICVNASDIPVEIAGADNDFWDDFKIQLWEYWVEVTPAVGGNPPVVEHNEREIWEVSLSQVLTNNGVDHFTGWKHLRIPLSLFAKVPWGAAYWRYGNYVSQAAYNDMNDSLDTDRIRAIIFRKDRVVDAYGDPTEPDDRVTVAIDEIVVTAQAGADAPRVARINVPGATSRCDDNEDRGLCWAQLFIANVANVDDETVHDLPYSDPVQPWPPSVANDCIDVTVWVRDWQDLNATFSAEVDNGAEVAEDDVSSEIVFVPQFQAPGTWVERWGLDFSRRKGTIHVPATPPLDERFLLFYTEWRYDYTDGDHDERWLVHYNPALLTPQARLDPSADPQGGFLANYLREYGYAYGTLFVLPRDSDGNIGRAEVVDVLFRTAAPRQLRHDRLITGLP